MAKKIAIRNRFIHEYELKEINICPYCPEDTKRDVIVAYMVTTQGTVLIHGRCFRHRNIKTWHDADRVEALTKEEISYLQVMTS